MHVGWHFSCPRDIAGPGMNAELQPVDVLLSDEMLEREIQAAYTQFNAAATLPERKSAWEAMKALIKRRSPQQVAKLEAIRKLLPDSWKVTVCSACLHASCWQGEFTCIDAGSAGTKQVSIGELRAIAKRHKHWEHESWWGKDEDVIYRLANLGVHDVRS